MEAWTIIEPGFYLIAACLPSLRPLLIQIIHRARTRTPYARTDKPGHWSSSIVDRNKQFRKLKGSSHPDPEFGQLEMRTVVLGGVSDAADMDMTWIPLDSINMAQEVHVSSEASQKGASG